MSWQNKYLIEFASSQLQNGTPNIFFINILEKDYTGNVTKLTGAAKPFILFYQSGDDNIIVPIRASECSVSFYDDGNTPLTVFYSEDDETFKIEFYYRSLFGDQLLWSGFLLQDSCQQDFQDPPTVVQVKATDNIALLKDIPFDLGIGKVSLFAIITAALTKTGIELPLHILSNIYENTTNDRNEDSVATLFEQTLIFTGLFQNEDGGWQDYYSILEKILTALNATILQAQGRWYVIRFPEYKYFALNHITGTFWQSDFTLPQFATYQPNFLFAHGTDNEFINADQTRRITRPFKFVKNTFNYHQPRQLILGSDLQRLGAVIGTSTDGDLRYDDYELPADWTHINGDTSFIRIVTDTITDTETTRYVYQPKVGNDLRFVRFNPIEVSAGDSFDFSLQFKHASDTNDNDIFNLRFILVTTDDQYYPLTRFPAGEGYPNVHWTGPFACAVIDTATVVGGQTILGTADDSQFTSFSLSSFVEEGGNLPVFPVDGMLLIDVGGSNDTNLSYPDIDMLWKDITVTFTNTINDSTDIIGQYHLQEQADNIKNVYDEEIFMDDSPRNTIAGTLFTLAVTSFCADIGDTFFTRTSYWHRLAITESLRLGEIITKERKDIASRPRTIIEGSFIFNQPALCIINAVQLGSLPGLNFLIGVCDIDYYSGVISCTLKELYTDSEVDKEIDYRFSYIFETN